MTKNELELDRYLQRIRLSARVKPTADGLESLQRAQLTTIPFENFDILLGRGISVEPDAIRHKLLHHERGGYCFEVNSLFLMALQALGFEARPLLARVHLAGPASGRSHQLSLVELSGKAWIADVGFGGQTIRAPLPLTLNQPVTHDNLTYRLIEVEPWGIMLQEKNEDGWQNLYSFDFEHVCLADIEIGNYFTATNPRSFFTFARVAALQTPEGIITLFNTTLKRKIHGVEHVEELPEGQAYLDALAAHFGIRLDAPYEQLRPLPSVPEGAAA